MKRWCDFATDFFFFLLKLGQSGQVTLTFALRHTAWKLRTWGGSSLNYSHNLVFPPFALLMSVLVILVLWSLHVRDAWGRVASSAEEVALTYVGQGVGWCLCRTLPPQGERREGGGGCQVWPRPVMLLHLLNPDLSDCKPAHWSTWSNYWLCI